MRMPISVKISSVIAVSVAITAALLAYFSHVSIDEGLDRLANENLKTSINFAKYEFDELKKGYLQLVETQAVRPNIVKGIVDNDAKLLKDLGDTLISTKASDIAVFTDSKGNVIVRSHNDKKGDNIANQDGIKKAISGNSVVTFESGNVVKFGVRAYAPVKNNGKVVGCIVIGQDLTKDFSFVDGLKRITGAEYTLFYGKERITTTLEVNGSRAIGTTLDNADIANTVLNVGKEFFGENILFGKVYKTAYVPLLSDGKVVGMIFSGLNQESIITQANSMIKNISILAGACILIFLLIGYLVSKKISKPIVLCELFAKEVSVGNYSNELLVKTNDETKSLSQSLIAMRDNIKQQIAFSEGVMKGINVPFSVFSNEDRTVYTNTNMLDLLDIPGNPQDYIGMQSGEYIFSIKGKETLSTTVLREKRASSIDTKIETRKGNSKFVHISSSPFYNDKNDILGTVSIWIDQTEVIREKERAEHAKTEGMHEAAQKIENVVEIITSASEELSGQVEQSSRGSEQQSNQISETATAMEEMNTTILEVAKNASNAADISSHAKEKTRLGEDAVNKVVDGIQDVQKTAIDLKNDVILLGRQAEGIGNVLNVISDIADQTNLLALNAAIEAARAGDAGRGFAVVADEVRKLAEKTMTATKEVGQAIVDIQEGTKTNVTNVENAVSKIDKATIFANEAGNILKEIVVFVDQSSDQIRSIATASEQQSAASEEINRSIEQVSIISQETSEAMRQSSQAVGELAKQSSVLRDLIVEMKSESNVKIKSLS